jgi:hypothetical protein
MMNTVSLPNMGGSGTPIAEVLLARLVPLDIMKENLQSYTTLQLLEMSLTCAHEAAHSVYIKQVYTRTIMVENFLRDELLGAYRTIAIEERVYNAVKIVQKLIATSIATRGQIGRGDFLVGIRGGASRRRSNIFSGDREDYKDRDRISVIY